MSDSEIQSIALFFFFSTLDDRIAKEASIETWAFCQKKFVRNKNLNPQAILVAGTYKIWNKYQKKITRGKPQYNLNSGWALPENLNMGAWTEFQKKTPEDELLAVIWSKIININDEDISSGLGITKGTIRFRVGRGLRKLGLLINQGQSSLTVVR